MKSKKVYPTTLTKSYTSARKGEGIFDTGTKKWSHYHSKTKKACKEVFKPTHSLKSCSYLPGPAVSE